MDEAQKELEAMKEESTLIEIEEQVLDAYRKRASPGTLPPAGWLREPCLAYYSSLYRSRSPPCPTATPSSLFRSMPALVAKKTMPKPLQSPHQRATF